MAYAPVGIDDDGLLPPEALAALAAQLNNSGTAMGEALSAAGVPLGGTTGQVLKKASGDDRDADWADEHAPDPSEEPDGLIATTIGGHIVYVAPSTTLDDADDETVASTLAVADAVQVAVTAASDAQSDVDELRLAGVTGERPVEGAFIGQPFFDTTLGMPLWWDGTEWVDATGTAA